MAGLARDGRAASWLGMAGLARDGRAASWLGMAGLARDGSMGERGSSHMRPKE